MAFPKLTEDRAICFYCREPIKFGAMMEFTLPDIKPAPQACNEKE